MAPLSPMMQQYFEIKKQHKDHILFFRLGDFYEMFYDDAKLASKELELVLTGRDCGQEERAPMCGVPYHSCDAYIARLIKKGYKVAICEQTEDPKAAKGVVRREGVRVVTPGTVIEADMLDESANNYILCIFLRGEAYGLAFADISTGQVSVTAVLEGTEALKNEMVRFSPSEVVFNAELFSHPEIGDFIREKLACCAGVLDDEAFEQKTAERLISEQFAQNAAQRPELSEHPEAFLALGGLLSYLRETQKTGVERLVGLEYYQARLYMTLDATAERTLKSPHNANPGAARQHVSGSSTRQTPRWGGDCCAACSTGRSTTPCSLKNA
jgi:DNA mismatch repair protein MutS